MLKGFLLVGFGGMIGSMLRYLFSVMIKPAAFPYATFAVNITGCLVIGLVIGIAIKTGSGNDQWKLFLATGLCGGFTTFSAFSLECISLIEQQRYIAVITYISLSIILGLAATFAGLQLAKL
jgi:CrcB protein